MLDDRYFMQQALREAHKAFENGEVPVGAVVVVNERIITRAHNLTETLNDVTAMPRCKPSLLQPMCWGGNT
jgi:tRNA(adenine34) deaminase